MNTSNITGHALLATIIIGIIGALTVNAGIDINLSADVEATAKAMLEAETRLRGRAYLSLLVLGLNLLFLVGVFRLLKTKGPMMAGWSLLVGLGAALLSLVGAVAAMNVAELAGGVAYQSLASAEQRLLLAGLQATSDYTSFHLSLVLSSVSNAGFFWLFLLAGGLPKITAGWGLFASLFVATAIVARDFIPAFGHDLVTMAFMLANLTALIATGVYLVVWGKSELA